MWHEYINATTVEQVISILAEKGKRARIVAGATDLILEIEREVRTGIDTLVDITRIPGLDQITLDEDQFIHLGPLVTHNHCVASKLIQECAFPLAMAAWEVGAPQIRNRGTIAGNLITASPANDTITPLMALGGRVTLRSQEGERQIALKDFYTGVRKIVMRDDEMLVDIAFPAMQDDQKGTFIKLGLRRAQAIAVVNVAVLLKLENKSGNGNGYPRVKSAAITLGSVAPTIVHAVNAEVYLEGRELSPAVCEHCADLSTKDAHPIDDVRSSADYRREMVRVCTLRALRAVQRGDERKSFPAQPVLLWGKDFSSVSPALESSSTHSGPSRIETNINGKAYIFESGYDKTLLRLLREEAGLIGTKEGCAEGECGACTVFLDGVAVMSCLIPAARAHQAHIITIEGLAQEDHLHPVQQAFIDEGAVQCGYCTPGFIMSAAKLLEERPHPTTGDVQQAITGNLCRCTGYYKIVQAIERASEREVTN